LKISNPVVSVEEDIVKRMDSRYPPLITGTGDLAFIKSEKMKAALKPHGFLFGSAIMKLPESI
jgi:hypothetical protein